MVVRGFALVAASLIVAAAATGVGTGVGAKTTGWRWNLPAGVEVPGVPADNPMTPDKIALGRRLFYDGRLSVGGTMSCATCHQQHRAFASATVTHPGIGGNPGRRNVPGLVNVAWHGVLSWHDPNVSSLEAQVATPMFGTSPVEMGARPKEVLGRLSADACYRDMFRAADPAGGGTITISGIYRALAAFQRTMVSYSTPYDADRRGDATALSPAARRGKAVFEGNCASCHSGPNFADDRFHAIRAPDPEADDAGLMDTTGKPADNGRFRTAPLRNVALTGPYMHDGSVATLPAAIRRHDVAAGMGEGEVGDLVSFLGALTDEAFVRNPALSRPTSACGKTI